MLQKMRDPLEREARLAELERDKESEGTAHLPDPVLYPIMSSRQPGDDGGSDDEDDDLVFDEYDSGGQRRKRRRQRGDGPDLDDEGRVCTGIPAFPLMLWVDIQGKWTEEKSLIAFQGKFGGLPARAMLEVTKMMYRYVHQSKHLWQSRLPIKT